MRRSFRVVLLVLAGGLVVVAALGAGPFRGQVKRLGAKVLGRIRRTERRRMPPEPPFFSSVALSQVGYAPAMRKEFTAPGEARGFAIEDARDGRRVFEGRTLRTLESPLLGPGRKATQGDFTSLRTPGRYRVVMEDGRTSPPFDVGPGVFDAPLRAVQRWFYFQRAFSPVVPDHAEGPWVHGSDAALAPPGVRGGWHDAGDFSLYSAPTNAALFWLLLAAADFPGAPDDTNIPESGNGVPDLLDEARWGLEWLLSVQEPASGGFRNTTCQTAYGPYGTNFPERMAPYRAGEVGTQATARAVGTLGFAASVFQKVDPAFAARCLAAARAGQAYLDARPGEATDGPTCSSARADGDLEVGRRARSYAAAGMLLATSEARYRQDFDRTHAEPQVDPGFLHLESHAALLYLRAPAADPARARALRARLDDAAREVRARGQAQPFGWATLYHWGSVGAGFLRSGLFSARRCREDPTGAAEDCDQALANLHVVLGRNGLGVCFVSGLPGVTRAVTGGFHHWLAALRAVPRDMPGLIPGGPNELPRPDDLTVAHARPIPIWGYWDDPAFPRDGRTPVEGRWTDNDSWSTNEPSIEWEAEAVYHLALARWLARRVP